MTQEAILTIHRMDGSGECWGVHAAGPIEDLLDKYGEKFIERVEKQAKADPVFARVVGGVWKSGMSLEVWERLQGVWDRRGWDRIPD